MPCYKLIVFILACFTSCVALQMHKSYESTQFSEVESSRTKRQASGCADISGDIPLLKEHTDIHIFANDSNAAISLVWSGTEGVIIALTTMSATMSGGSSHLYRSVNHGRSFTDISTKIENNQILHNRGLRVNPIDTSYVILITTSSFRFFGADISTVIYVSTDSGNSINKVTCPFTMNPDTMQFNPKLPLRMLVLSSTDHSLWISQDFGIAWTKVADNVMQVRWDSDHEDLFYYTKDPTKQMEDQGFNNELYKASLSKDGSLVSTKLAEHVHSFGIQGGFLFVSIEYLNHNGSRVMHVSKEQGANWNAAQIPLIAKEQFYSLLDMTEQMVFVHVDSSGDGGEGVIYTSDERGIIYSKSLQHHLYQSQGSLTDFYKVESLSGVYITSQLLKDHHDTIHTVITYDKGGTWETISAPENSVCPSSETECRLQIHSLFSSSKGVQIPELPKSSSSAPGIIIAHGNIGDALNSRIPDVYISSDGGYSWTQPHDLKGPHFYAIGDSGGILYAVQAFVLTNTLKFSLDEGQCWQEYKFTSSPIVLTGLSVEPGLRSTALGLWGWDKSGDGLWRAISVDFSAILKKPCKQDDYELWMAHESNSLFSKTDACLLGSKVVFKKRKKGSVCANGKDFKTEAVMNPCLCTKTDFLCDYGYVRGDSQECALDSSSSTSFADICVEDMENTIETQGYRKIPGDKCEGGYEPKTTIHSLHKSCIKTEVQKDDYGVSNNRFTDYSSSSRWSPIPFLVIALIAAILTLIGVFFYILRQRRKSKLRVKYTSLIANNDDKLQQANGDVEGYLVDDTSAAISYHDDSDDDLLVT